MVTQTLGSRLRQLRQDRGLTLMALAGDAHMSTSYLADIEHDRTVPTLGRLQAVATALEVTVRELLQGVEPYDTPSV